MVGVPVRPKTKNCVADRATNYSTTTARPVQIGNRLNLDLDLEKIENERAVNARLFVYL